MCCLIEKPSPKITCHKWVALIVGDLMQSHDPLHETVLSNLLARGNE